MSSVPLTLTVGLPAPADPAGLLEEAAAAAKCAACGCAHQASAALAGLPDSAPPRLRDAAQRLSASLTGQRYPCLGCEVCWPAEALSLVQEAGLITEGAACPAEPVQPRPGWPPLPGDYTVLRYTAPVAVCTLGDAGLAAAVAAAGGPQVAITGKVEQRIGHHPGGSLLALAANGTDERGRIIAAPGRRPRLRNLTPDEIAHFRTRVQVVDLIGTREPGPILAAAASCAARDPGPAPAPPGGLAVPVQRAAPAGRAVADPAGYLVIHADARRQLLVIEHYRNDGLLTTVTEAATAADGYVSVLGAGLASRLDHAAYLGRELARAEHALRDGTRYQQDAAPG